MLDKLIAIGIAIALVWILFQIIQIIEAVIDLMTKDEDLQEAIDQSEADIQSGRYISESADQHIRRIKSRE